MHGEDFTFCKYENSPNAQATIHHEELWCAHPGIQLPVGPSFLPCMVSTSISPSSHASPICVQNSAPLAASS